MMKLNVEHSTSNIQHKLYATKISEYWKIKNRDFIGVVQVTLIQIVKAATGVKNQRHESRTDEDVYLYLRTSSAKSKHTFLNVKTDTKQMHS